jgi:hypothetical protein
MKIFLKGILCPIEEVNVNMRFTFKGMDYIPMSGNRFLHKWEFESDKQVCSACGNFHSIVIRLDSYPMKTIPCRYTTSEPKTARE